MYPLYNKQPEHISYGVFSASKDPSHGALAKKSRKIPSAVYCTFVLRFVGSHLPACTLS